MVRVKGMLTNRRALYDDKYAVLKGLGELARGCVIFATPLERREALQQQRRVEVASKVIKINRSTEAW